MIIELFGPVSSGKTTFARALAIRLKERGHAAEILLSYAPGKYRTKLDPGGVLAAVKRITHAVGSAIAVAGCPHANGHCLKITSNLMAVLPPKNVLWFIRFAQYILHLIQVWRRMDPSRLVIFDQAFIQAVCSLALFNGAADQRSLKKALDLIPKSDLAIRLEAPQDVLKARLQDRIRLESFAERLFEADINLNLQMGDVIEQVSQLLELRGFRIIKLDVCNRGSFDAALDRVEKEILSRIEVQSAFGAVGRSSHG